VTKNDAARHRRATNHSCREILTIAHDKAGVIIRSDFERLTRDGRCELRYASLLDFGAERASRILEKCMRPTLIGTVSRLDYISRR
jgi:hypothetical protein